MEEMKWMSREAFITFNRNGIVDCVYIWVEVSVFGSENRDQLMFKLTKQKYPLKCQDFWSGTLKCVILPGALNLCKIQKHSMLPLLWFVPNYGIRKQL